MALFTNFHSWLAFRNTRACGLLKLCCRGSSAEPCTDLEADFQVGTGASRERVRQSGREIKSESIWRYIAAQHAKTNQSSKAGTAAREEDYKVQPSKSHWLWSSVSPWINRADSRPPSLSYIAFPFYSAMENCGPPISSTKNQTHTLSLCMCWDFSPARVQLNTHLSMWAALKTTSNSPLSRRAAFSAISAASSSRDSSNKNWPGRAGEKSSTVKTVKDPYQGTEEYTVQRCWLWPMRRDSLVCPGNNMLKY